MPHNWLKKKAGFYDEIKIDYRAKDSTHALKNNIHLQIDGVQCREMRRALPGYLVWSRFFRAWKPVDLILP